MRAVLPFFAFGVLGALGLSACRPATTAAPTAPLAATVVRVIDGDTVDLRFGSTTERVRLIGVDTPETVKPNTPVQCFGPEASAHTKALLPKGTAVTVERDLEPRDTYGRLLLYVRRSADGLFVNLDLARGGFARPLTIAPNTAHADEIGAAVEAARSGKVGLWGTCGG
jgi:micrococcal nuclease